MLLFSISHKHVSCFLLDTLPTHVVSHTHTHTTETAYRVSQITRCYGNSAATHQRDGKRERKEAEQQDLRSCEMDKDEGSNEGSSVAKKRNEKRLR